MELYSKIIFGGVEAGQEGGEIALAIRDMLSVCIRVVDYLCAWKDKVETREEKQERRKRGNFG